MSDILDYSTQAQAARRADLQRIHREFVGAIDNSTIEEGSPRSRMWEALAWLSGPAPDQEAIERYVLGPDPWGPCAFCPAVSMQLLVRFAGKMTDALRRHLEQYAYQYLDKERGARFSGYNDNFPAMSACCLALAGAYFGESRHSRGAEEVLASARDLLTRRDYLSEYLSLSLIHI